MPPSPRRETKTTPRASHAQSKLILELSQSDLPQKIGIPGHTCPGRSRLEVRLDTERLLNGRREDWRSVKIRGNQESGEGESARLSGCRQQRKSQWIKRNSLPRRRREERRVDHRHGLAAILAMMAVGRARHGVATIHRLFRRGHRVAIKRIRRESDSQSYQQNCFPKSHRD